MVFINDFEFSFLLIRSNIALKYKGHVTVFLIYSGIPLMPMNFLKDVFHLFINSFCLVVVCSFMAAATYVKFGRMKVCQNNSIYKY